MTITAGTATFNGTVTTGGLTQSGGELNGTGTLTVTGTGPVPASSFSNGTQSGSGTTIAQNGATFSSTGFGLDGGRTLQLGGASTTSGASVQINLNSSNPNNSVSDVGSGTLTILSGATFTDATTGGLTIFTTNHGTGDTGVTAAVNNAGTFTKTASGTSTISTLFNNSGTVNVTSGSTLNLSGGGTDVGAVYAGAGTIEFGGGTRTLDATSSITGNALFAGNATTFTTVNGGVGTGLMTITAGTATFNGTVTTGGLTQSGGELNGTGTLTVTGTGPVPASSFSNGTQSGSGTTLAQNGATFSSTGFGLDGGRTLQLGGASTTSGASVQINLNSSNPNNSVSDVGSGTLTILSGATFTDATTGGLTIFTTNHGTGDTGVTAAVNNAGTFTKTASGTSTISTLFNNTGTVNVTSGSTLNLSGGGTDVGAVYAGAGTIEFGGGTRTLDATSSITGNALFAGNATTFTTVNGGVGTGLMTITAGTATFNGTVTTGGLTQSGGELNGTGTLTVTGTGPVPASNFSNGTQSGSGTTLAQNGATFSSTGFGLDGGRTLQLGGASTTSGASVQINLNSSNPNNSVSDVGSGTLTILSGATFTDATTGGLTIFTTNHGTGDTGVTAAVNNAGTFTKTASGTSTISTLFNNTGDCERHIRHAESERRRYGQWCVKYFQWRNCTVQQCLYT